MKTRSVPLAADWPSLVKRVERLERQNRLLRIASVFGLILLSGVLFMGQSSQDRTLTAGRLELVDRNGRIRAALGMTDIGPALLLVDEEGKTRVSLRSTATGSSLKLYDAIGRMEGGAFEVNASSHEFRLHDQSGKVRTGLVVSDEGPGIILADASGKPRISLDLRGGSGISILGSTGRQGLTLDVDDNNNPRVLLYDSSLKQLRTELIAGGLGVYDTSGSRQITLSSGNGGPQLFLRDPAGRVRASLFVSETGPLLALSDANGKLLFSKP